ncbi:hypothetical protein WN51_00598 [Melipona quadrifasciata]|uniref:Uncharacterized protein n=1 Tax=Melipona quadrifasciata TaxID=166423 RepID=A0A0M9A2D6_9HYME|nr:hypothetical protein WN51_00598 [Melipona quadrifasciata]
MEDTGSCVEENRGIVEPPNVLYKYHSFPRRTYVGTFWHIERVMESQSTIRFQTHQKVQWETLLDCTLTRRGLSNTKLAGSESGCYLVVFTVRPIRGFLMIADTVTRVHVVGMFILRSRRERNRGEKYGGDCSPWSLEEEFASRATQLLGLFDTKSRKKLNFKNFIRAKSFYGIHSCRIRISDFEICHQKEEDRDIIDNFEGESLFSANRLKKAIKKSYRGCSAATNKINVLKQLERSVLDAILVMPQEANIMLH